MRANPGTVLFRHVDAPALREAFASLGYPTCFASSAAEEEAAIAGGLLLCISSMYREVKQPLTSLRMRQRINAAGAPLICWNRDGPSHMGAKAWRLWLLRHIDFMDAYATHTLQDAGHFASEVIYLPNAAWDTHYHLDSRTLESLRDISTYRHSVSFFGALDATRYPEMARRTEFFAALASRLDDIGIDHHFTGESLSFAQQRELIQRSRINLNFHAGCDTRYRGGYRGQPSSWGLPERCFGIPACGGFLLSDYRPHAYDAFINGEEWADFSDLDDCIAKIRFHLDHFDETRQIAEAAWRRVQAQHRYVHRAEHLLRFADYWRSMRNSARGTANEL